MNSPSTKYLYGFVSTFGTSVNVTPDEIAAWEAEFEAEREAFRKDARPRRVVTPVTPEGTK